MAARLESPQRLTADLLSQAAGSGSTYTLDLSKHGLTSLCPFRSYPKLQSLNLSYNKLQSLHPPGLFDGIKDLKELRLTDNSVSSLSEIRGMTGLVSLYAEYNMLNSVEELGSLKVMDRQRLKVVRLDGNPLMSIRGLGELQELEVLGLARCQLQEIERLPKVRNTQVQDLDLSYNSLKSLPALPEALKSLSLNFNKVSDLSFLSSPSLEVPSTQTLEIQGNRLETMESLPRLPSLHTFLCSKNQLYMIGTALELTELLPNLCNLDLSSNSLYSKLELLCLARSPAFMELDLRDNPCSAYTDFEREVSAEFPYLRALNNKLLARLTPQQVDLERLKTSFPLGIEEENKEIPSNRPTNSRNTAKKTNFKGNVPQTIEEMHRKNFLEDLNSSILSLKQEFKAAMTRLKSMLQSAFALPGEQIPNFPTFSTAKIEQNMEKIEEIDEDKFDLEQSVKIEEEKWFSREMETDPVLAIIQKASEIPEIPKSAHKVKRKTIKNEKTGKNEESEDRETPVVKNKTSSRWKQKLLEAQKWMSKE